jgi:hypothetical protein
MNRTMILSIELFWQNEAKNVNDSREPEIEESRKEGHTAKPMRRLSPALTAAYPSVRSMTVNQLRHRGPRDRRAGDPAE